MNPWEGVAKNFPCILPRLEYKVAKASNARSIHGSGNEEHLVLEHPSRGASMGQDNKIWFLHIRFAEHSFWPRFEDLVPKPRGRSTMFELSRSTGRGSCHETRRLGISKPLA